MVWLLAACAPAAAPAPVPTAAAPPNPTSGASPPPDTPTALPTPPSEPSHTPEPSAEPPAIRLLFTGDINPGRCPAQIALARNDFTVPYHIVGEALRAADITIGSLDGTISDISPPSPCPETMNLIGPARTVEGLLYAGFDVITVATNHAKDCGRLGWNCDERALRDTLANLAAAGIAPVGGGEDLAAARAPVIVERHGVRFAFLGLTEVGPETWAGAGAAGTAPLSEATLPEVLADIRAARALADVVVVLPQWGTEYAERPNEVQQRWAAAMVAAGAALIIGNHPHLVQPVQVFSAEDGALRGVAAYALGNFVFDQGPWRTRQGVLFAATFHGPTLAAWGLLPIHIRSLHQPHWADPTEAAEILERSNW
jgi:poly-gamma-glutamate synthesis protein (capsule biosynthesis protein)